jgi:hypothetical protein
MQLQQGLGLHRGGFKKPFEIALDTSGLVLLGTPDDSTTLNAKMAADFVAANNESLSSSAAAFDKGNESFSYGGWVKTDSAGSGAVLGAKYGNAGNRSYLLNNNASGSFRAWITSDGSTLVTATSTGHTETNWNFVVFVYDADADLIKISVNAETFITTSHTTGAYASATEDFKLGSRLGAFYDMSIDNAFFYDKALSQAQVNTLYNSGNGTAYEDADKTSLVSWWSLNEISGNRVDEVGANNLTDNNTVGITLGKVQDNVEDQEAVWRLVDQSSNAYNIDQGTVASQALYDDTLKALVLDGADDFLDITQVLTGDLASTTVGTWAAWFRLSDITSSGVLISFGDTNALEYIRIYNTTSGQIAGNMFVAGTQQWAWGVTAAAFVNDTWAHIAIVHNGTDIAVYVNGTAQTVSYTVTTDKTAWFNDASGLDNGRIGCSNNNSAGNATFHDGEVAQPLISTSALTAGDITNIYNDQLSTYS